MKMKLFFIIAIISSILIAACSEEKRIDSSSEAALNVSFLQLAKGMPKDKLEKLNNAIYGIASILAQKAEKNNRPPDDAHKEFYTSINGKSADEIIAMHEKLKSQN